MRTLRRLENDETNEFWEAWVNDLTLSCRSGDLGSEGTTEHDKFRTRADALAELEARLEDRLDDGFFEVWVEVPKPPVEPNVFLFFFLCVLVFSLALMVPSRARPVRYGRPNPSVSTPEHPSWGP